MTNEEKFDEMLTAVSNYMNDPEIANNEKQMSALSIAMHVIDKSKDNYIHGLGMIELLKQGYVEGHEDQLPPINLMN